MPDPENSIRGIDLRIDLSSSVPIYVQITDQVRAAVAEGRLYPGDPLPSIRRLAGELQVSPGTILQAYRELERAGVSYVQRGQGTFIGDTLWLDRRAERRRIGLTLVNDLLEKAYRLGLSGSEIRALLVQRLAGSSSSPGERSRDYPPRSAAARPSDLEFCV